MKTQKKEKPTGAKSRYIIDLYKRRSVIALVSGLLIFFITFANVSYQLTVYTQDKIFPLEYFTGISNIMSAICALFIIPYAVEGIRMKLLSPPAWLMQFQLCCMVSISIVCVATLTIIVPTTGVNSISKTGFWLHLINPMLTLFLFFSIESTRLAGKKNYIISLIPFFAYSIVYGIMVLGIGSESGGWNDFYQVAEHMPPVFSALIIYSIGILIAFVILAIRNRLSRGFEKRLSRQWDPELSPIELKIEVFGLGRYVGAHSDKALPRVPIEIFEMIASRYEVTVKELTNAYVKGMMDSLSDRGREIKKRK